MVSVSIAMLAPLDPDFRAGRYREYEWPRRHSISDCRQIHIYETAPLPTRCHKNCQGQKSVVPTKRNPKNQGKACDRLDGMLILIVKPCGFQTLNGTRRHESNFRVICLIFFLSVTSFAV